MRRGRDLTLYDRYIHVTVRNDRIRSDKTRDVTMRHDTIRCDTMRYDTMRRDAMRCDTHRRVGHLARAPRYDAKATISYATTR